MSKRRYLSRRQLWFLEDLFGSELDEEGVLEKHRVRRSTYERWLGDAVFAERFKQHLNAVRRRSELLMAKYSCVAAAKLVELTASGKEETARRACMDIMTMPGRLSEEVGPGKTGDKSAERAIAELSPERASRLLAMLAEQK